MWLEENFLADGVWAEERRVASFGGEAWAAGPFEALTAPEDAGAPVERMHGGRRVIGEFGTEDGFFAEGEIGDAPWGESIGHAAGV